MSFCDEHPLPQALIDYVEALSEPISIYTRYMDALLIKRPDQPAFFRDLKAFRCQRHIIALLTATAPPDFNSKKMYFALTQYFIASRFAHPWCRVSRLKEGWNKAEWGSIKKQSEAEQREEQRLHKLLVPFWCAFRARMMASEQVLEQWIEAESQRKTTEQDSAEASEIQSNGRTDDSSKTITSEKSGISPAVEALDARRLNQIFRNPEAYCMELSDDEDMADQGERADNAAAAAKLFVGVAATGFLASNKRARKYLGKKLKKYSK